MGVLQHLVLRPAMAPEGAALYLTGSAERNDRGVRVLAGSRLSAATYFNALPATFWRRFTRVRTVTLRLAITGSGDVIVRGTDATGTPSEVTRVTLEGGPEVAVDVDLDRFAVGGWLWFEIKARSDVEITSGGWHAKVPPTPLTTVAMTTMNKPDFAVRTLASLAARPEVLAVVDQVLVMDQGSRLVREHEDFAGVAAALGDRLRVLEQANGGGSSGFARGMIEALARPSSESVLLLDDDVVLEPDSVYRAVVFASVCTQPMIVGGHMLDLNRPTRLHSWAEKVDQTTFMWGPTVPESARFDLSTVRSAPAWMQHPVRTDYNGWFMCLIPRRVIAQIGASVPMFLKWDDAEYGLRAAAAGFPTVTLPGVALWHLSWLDKIDTVDWQAYYHSRNRLVAALLHADRPRGGGLLRDSRRQHLKQLLSMEYYAVTVRNQALRDVLSGPSHLASGLYSTLPRLRALMAEHPEMRVTPLPEPATPAHDRAPVPGPRGLTLLATMGRAVARHLVITPRADHPVALSYDEATWWRLPFVDAVDVATPDGLGERHLRRRRGTFARLWWESIRCHLRLRLGWGRLSRAYRQALPEMTAPESWWRLVGERPS